MASILVVDDDEHVRAIVMKTLSAERHTARAVPNTAAALRALEAEPADVVIMSLDPASGDGPLQLDRLTRAFPHVPVIATFGGGRAGREVVDELEGRAGLLPVLRKPLSPDAVRQAVRQALAAKPPPDCGEEMQ